jgi:hypothetical protein
VLGLIIVASCARKSTTGSDVASVGLRIGYVDPKFAGDYTNAFAVLTNDGKLDLAIVRGCPQLTCAILFSDAPSDGARTMAELCPESGLATIAVPNQKAGTFELDVQIGAPARKADIATLENVRFEVTSISSERITGSAQWKSGQSSMTGRFDAKVCR